MFSPKSLCNLPVIMHVPAIGRSASKQCNELITAKDKASVLALSFTYQEQQMKKPEGL